MAYIRFTSGPLQGKEYEIPLGERRIIGRGSTADIICPDRKSSRRHCVIESGMLGYLVTDLDSANGTWVKDNRVSEASLIDGDSIRIGETLMVFVDAADYDAAATQFAITAKRSKMAIARDASKGQQEGYISAKSHFCETCAQHIAEEDRESGASEKIEGVWLCQKCTTEYKALQAAGKVDSVQIYTAFLRRRDLAEKPGKQRTGPGAPGEETGLQPPVE